MKFSSQNYCSKLKGIETAGVTYLHKLDTHFYCICIQLWKALNSTQIDLNLKKFAWITDEKMSFLSPTVSHTNVCEPQFSFKNQEKFYPRNLFSESQII